MTVVDASEDFSALHTNQRLILHELQKRGVSVEIFDAVDEIVVAHYRGHTEFLLDRDSSINPYAATVLCSNKYHTKKLLQAAGIGTPKGMRFYGNEIRAASDYAYGIGFPVVVKPCMGSHGDFVAIDLKSHTDVYNAIQALITARGAECSFIVEQFCPGQEIRLFYSRRGAYAALHREPAAVTGDGRQTIAELIAGENQRRADTLNSSLCPLRSDDPAVAMLAGQGFDLKSVPQNGQKIFLTKNSNVTTGGMCSDVTDLVHPEYLALADRALKLFPGMPYAGFDIITHDISSAEGARTCRFLEANSNPGIKMHHMPGAGQSRNVAAMIADLIFPETIPS